MRLTKIVENLHQHCYLDKIIYYIKVHCIQAPLEAFIGLFLFVWGMIYTNPNLLKNDDIIKVPIGLASIICLIYLVIINIVYIQCVRKIIAKNLNGERLFNEAETTFLKVSYFIHITGIVSYILVTSCIVVHFYGIQETLAEKKELIIIGSLVGVIWNWRGYSGDRRIDCRKIFRGIQDINMNQIKWSSEYLYKFKLLKPFFKNQVFTIRVIKLKYTILHIATNLITSIAVGCIYVYLVFNSIKGDSLIEMNIDIGNFNIGTYGFFVITFIFVFIFYLKTLYPLFYIQEKSIYCDFDQLLKCDVIENTNV